MVPDNRFFTLYSAHTAASAVVRSTTRKTLTGSIIVACELFSLPSSMLTEAKTSNSVSDSRSDSFSDQVSDIVLMPSRAACSVVHWLQSQNQNAKIQDQNTKVNTR